MTTLAQRRCAEVGSVAVDLPGTYRGSGRSFVDAAGSAERTEEALEAFPAWSSLSWDERADFVARYCL